MPASRPPEVLPSPLAVVCHDAGATHPLLAWLRQQPGMPGDQRPQAVMEGPAKLLWPQYFPDAPLAGSLQEALSGAAMVLTGTGWASDLEHEARRMARHQGLPSMALLDHWVNYPQRFERQGQVVLPDELWVTDEHARQEALRCFPGMPVRQIPNLYLSAQLQGIREAEAPDAVLYLLEPARATWGRSMPGEFQALDYFMANLNRIGLPDDTPVVLRPHPSDDPGKYKVWLSQHPSARLDNSLNLSDAINTCGWVAGTESYALTVALAAQRRVVCTLPPWAPACRLPQQGLIHLKDL